MWHVEEARARQETEKQKKEAANDPGGEYEANFHQSYSWIVNLILKKNSVTTQFSSWYPMCIELLKHALIILKIF